MQKREARVYTTRLDMDNMLPAVDDDIVNEYTGGGGGGVKIIRPVDDIVVLTDRELYYGLMPPVNEKYELLDGNGNPVEPKVLIFREKFKSVLSGDEWLVVDTIKVS